MAVALFANETKVLKRVTVRLLVDPERPEFDRLLTEGSIKRRDHRLSAVYL